MLHTLALTMVLGTTAAAGQASDAAWLTRAESSGFTETSRYDETLEDCQRLEKDSPWVRVTSIGTSPEGRQLILVIASKDRAFDPRAAARTGKPIVLVQAGIHAGEIDGKDAGIMLLRNITTGSEQALLDRAIILFLPIYNVDGHERFGPYNRINQNGPREAGWRTTSRNLNLNRDYVKADAVETRAWLSMFTSWWPDLLIDCHVTDGADFQYDVTYWDETSPNSPLPVRAWMAHATKERVVPELAGRGHRSAPYIFLKDDTDPASGFEGAPPTPRFSTSYAALQNRPAFLIETHMIKDYHTRVIATYDTLRALLRAVNLDAEGLRRAVREAEAAAVRPGPLALTFKMKPDGVEETFHGLKYRRELSEVSGGMRIVYGTEPMEMTVQRRASMEPDVTITKPAAYLVPPQWTEAIERLRAHGLSLQRLTRDASIEVEGYRLSSPSWNANPFEGHHTATFKTERLPAQARHFVAGTVVVPMDQRSSAVAAHLLEPQGPDSLVSWGFFDGIFEQKEYAEAYVLEALARDMMAKDPELKAAFERQIAADPEFARSPYKRLDFFFRHSPWWDDHIGLYPVARSASPIRASTEPLP
jgi:murein tripeptide amidase MpaA